MPGGKPQPRKFKRERGGGGKKRLEIKTGEGDRNGGTSLQEKRPAGLLIRKRPNHQTAQKESATRKDKRVNFIWGTRPAQNKRAGLVPLWVPASGREGITKEEKKKRRKEN